MKKKSFWDSPDAANYIAALACLISLASIVFNVLTIIEKSQK
ncbi:hypothetical protein [Fusobacterium gonidiaformans]|nr:hypothetical protein [Fusobacterium gonidiaformans]